MPLSRDGLAIIRLTKWLIYKLCIYAYNLLRFPNNIIKKKKKTNNLKTIISCNYLMLKTIIVNWKIIQYIYIYIVCDRNWLFLVFQNTNIFRSSSNTNRHYSYLDEKKNSILFQNFINH